MTDVIRKGVFSLELNSEVAGSCFNFDLIVKRVAVLFRILNSITVLSDLKLLYKIIPL